MPNVKSMRAPELAAMLRDKRLTSGKDYLIVDVRDDDFIGGHIPSAVNLPSHTLSDPAVVEEKCHEFAGIPKLIFHCALSQQRGPKAAMRFASTMGPNRANEIYVLIGGFSQWQQQYRNEPDLLANYDSKLWSDEWWS